MGKNVNSEDMDRIKAEYIVKNCYKIHGLLMQIAWSDSTIITPFSGENILLFEEIFKEAYHDSLNEKYYLVTVKNFNFYLFSAGDIKIAIGPFSYEKVERYEANIFFKSIGLEKENVLIPKLSAAKIKELILLFHGIIFEKYDLEQDDLFDDSNSDAEIETKQKLIGTMVENVDGGIQHFSYIREKEYFEKLVDTLSNGAEVENVNVPTLNDEFIDIKKGASILSESNFKDAEYNLVCCVTIASRYAMKAGADETEIFNLDDVILRNLSMARDIGEIDTLANEFWKELRIILTGKKTKYSPYIESVKNYIAKNIFKRIKLEDIANAIGVNPSYLSRVFSKEVGMTIFEYIKRKKIERSCNLLKYSDKSVAEIADYIALTPQSYFTKVFKQCMGTSPSAYRIAWMNQEK